MLPRKHAGILVNPPRDVGNAAGKKSKEITEKKASQNQVVQTQGAQKQAIQEKASLNRKPQNRRMSRQEILELMKRRYNSKPEQSGRKEKKVNV